MDITRRSVLAAVLGVPFVGCDRAELSDVRHRSGATTRQADASALAWPAMEARADRTGLSIPGLMYLLGATPAERTTLLDQMVDLGVGWLRFDLPLFMVEETPGVRDWTDVDAVVAAAKARGLKILCVLTTLPSWARTSAATDAGYEDWQEGAATGTQRSAFRDFAVAAATRYAGSTQGRKVDVWEIWNEPNITAFWAPTPSVEHYADLLTLTYTAMRAVTSAPIIAGGTGGTSGSPPQIRTTSWYQQLHEVGAHTYWDAANIHPYQDLGLARAGQLFTGGEYGQLSAVRAAQVAAGDAAKTIWGTEFGWPATPDGAPGNDSSASASFAEQASWITPTLDDWTSRPYTGVLFQYHIYDHLSATDGYRGYGVYTVDKVTKKEPFFGRWEAWLTNSS